jgi:hypothetical protein
VPEDPEPETTERRNVGKVAPLPDGFLENELEQHKRRLRIAEREVEKLRSGLAQARNDAEATLRAVARSRREAADAQADVQARLVASRARLTRMTCYAGVWALLAVGGAAVATIAVKTKLQLASSSSASSSSPAARR